MNYRKTIAVIGEGLTEKYYIESLKNLSSFYICPRELNRKASSIVSLKKNIDSAIHDGYD